MMIKTDCTGKYSAGDYELFYSLMSPERRQKADRLRNENDRRLCILADKTAREFIAEITGKNREEIEFYTGENGKPYIKDIPLFFSISHSGEYVACSVSRGRTGIDIEKISEKVLAVSGRFATENELDFIGKSEENATVIWTLKEAYLKATGTGISGGLKSVEFIDENGKLKCSDPAFEIRSEKFENGYIISVCEEKTGRDSLH